jgi:hypothetical protein
MSAVVRLRCIDGEHRSRLLARAACAAKMCKARWVRTDFTARRALMRRSDLALRPCSWLLPQAIVDVRRQRVRHR